MANVCEGPGVGPDGQPLETVTYLLCDTTTGWVLDRLPLTGSVAKQVGETGTASWSLPAVDPRLPPDWPAQLQPVKTMVVAVYRDRPIQAWVLTSVRYGGAELELGGATLERLAEKVYVREAEWYNVDESVAAAGVASQVLVPAGGWIVQYEPTGTYVDAYYDTDGAHTVKSALDELGATDTGPRWMADIRWAAGQEGYQVEKVLRIARWFGSYKPEARFTNANIVSYTRTLDWSSDYAALRVWGVTEGTGGTGITELPYESVKLQQGWHPWEAFVSFTDLDDYQLEARARRALADRQNGAVLWEVTCNLDTAPQLLDEWTIGDTVTLDVAPTDYDPLGGSLTTRVEGWELDDAARTITPLLYQEAEDDSG